MPDLSTSAPEAPALSTSEPTISVGSAGSGVAGAQLTNNAKKPQLAEGNCVVVPRPPVGGGGLPVFMVVQSTSSETTPRRFDMKLTGRTSVWLTREDSKEMFELLENVPYELSFGNDPNGVAVSLLQAGKSVWTTVVPRKRVIEAAASTNLFIVRDTVVRDEIDFDTGLGTATLVLSTVKP